MSRDEEVVRKIIIQRFNAAYNDLKPYYSNLTLKQRDVVDLIEDIVKISVVVDTEKLKGDVK